MSERIWIGRSRTGEAWHVTPNPGTAFPVAYCGAQVERRSMHTVNRPDEGYGFHPWECSKCRKAVAAAAH